MIMYRIDLPPFEEGRTAGRKADTVPEKFPNGRQTTSLGGHPAPRRRLRLMEVGRETVLRRRDGIQQHDGADLSPMTYAVRDHMHEHLLARHAARGAVSKREVDVLGEL